MQAAITVADMLTATSGVGAMTWDQLVFRRYRVVIRSKRWIKDLETREEDALFEPKHLVTTNCR